MQADSHHLLKTVMAASLLAALLATGTAAWAQEATVDGLAYAGDGVGVTNVEADIEFGEVVLGIDSAEGGTLTITLDSAVLGFVDGEFTAVVDEQAVEFTTTATDTTVEIVIGIPAGGAMVVLSGLEDATVVAASPDPVEETGMAEAVVETPEPVEETGMAEAPMVADFVEPGVDIAVYVNRYLNDAGFSSWYDEWYPATAFHESLGITQTEYQAIVDDLGRTFECPSGTELVDEQCVSICGAGTVLEDGMCVPDGRTSGTSASDADGFRAQGEGLQLGVAAAAGFGGAVGVVLLLWLPSRARKRWANRQRTSEE